MLIGVLAPQSKDERRVALVPEVVAKLVAAGHRIQVEPGAGTRAGFVDRDYVAAGAELIRPEGVDVLAVVELEDESSLPGSSVIGLLRPFDDPDRMRRLAPSGVTAWAFEAVPRTSRAQVVDALSSQATASGYQAVLEGAAASGKLLPMLTTAAGTIKPASVLVLGAGVAGLQAIATARRLGAVVSAFDVRAAAAEQVESLGARFVKVDLEAQDAAESGGYAREVGADDQQRVIDGLAPSVKAADIVICTAAIPGRHAPLLITRETAEAMRPGSVIVDLAAPTGGNCEATQPGEVVTVGETTVIGSTDLVSRVAADASRMYSRNVASFLALVTGEDGAFQPDTDDDIVVQSTICRGGAVVHPRLLEN